MKKYKYIGIFKSSDGHTYELDVTCNGFLQAFFLLTADAIRSSRHYQLDSISDEQGDIRKVSDIINCTKLIDKQA